MIKTCIVTCCVVSIVCAKYCPNKLNRFVDGPIGESRVKIVNQALFNVPIQHIMYV